MSHYKEKLNNISTIILDFDGVLSDGKVILLAGQDMPRYVNVKDGYILQLAIKKGYHIMILSGGISASAEERFSKLGLKDIYMGIENKLAFFEKYIKENSINPENVLYMGDDIPDYEVMTKVGLPTCPANACAEIKSISKYISHKNGGDGCVRDIIEQVMKVQGKWMDKDSFDW